MTLVLWTPEIPDANVRVELDEGEAVFQFKNFDRVFDAFSVPNSLSPDRPLGLVGATINSFRLSWNGSTYRDIQ